MRLSNGCGIPLPMEGKFFLVFFLSFIYLFISSFVFLFPPFCICIIQIYLFSDSYYLECADIRIVSTPQPSFQCGIVAPTRATATAEQPTKYSSTNFDGTSIATADGDPTTNGGNYNIIVEITAVVATPVQSFNVRTFVSGN